MTTRQEATRTVRPPSHTLTAPAFCDSCTNSACDEAGGDLDQDSIAILLMEMGADIADHNCDARETGEDCACACSCP